VINRYLLEGKQYSKKHTIWIQINNGKITSNTEQTPRHISQLNNIT
jgi:hypothetical protein